MVILSIYQIYQKRNLDNDSSVRVIFDEKRKSYREQFR